MDPQDITFALAFGAGVLSFISPCVLPLVPAYLGHLSGVAVVKGKDQGGARTVAHAALFVLGFSSVFVGVWTSIGLLGSVIPPLLPAIRQIGGILLVIMGFHVLGVFRIPFLYQEKRFTVGPGRSPSLPLSFLIGVVFAVGWTPCIGPVLGGIIGLATLSNTVGQGVLLLATYAAGLGVPFILAAVSLDRVMRITQRVKSHYAVVEAISGLLLIAIGVLMFTNLFARLPQYFYWGAL